MIPTSEIAVPVGLTTVSLSLLLGHDATFWVVVLSATVMKMLLSPYPKNKDGEDLNGRERWRYRFILFLAAVIPPFALTKGVSILLGIQESPVEWLVAFGLVIAGEGFMRWLIKASDKPDALIEWAWNIFRGMKK